MDMELLMNEALNLKCACPVCNKLRKEAVFQMRLEKESMLLKWEKERQAEKTKEGVALLHE